MNPLPPRQRILDAAFSLALEGGVEAMLMRDVAARAAVSTRTLHLHFPTKSFLLLAACVEQAEATDFFPETTRAWSGDPLERVLGVFGPPTEMLIALPDLAAGLVSALVAPDERAVPLLRSYRDSIHGRALRALAMDSPTPRDRLIARTLSQVWFAGLAGWVTGAEEPGSVMESVEGAARLMLER